MKNLILDTNIYRNLVHGKTIAQLKSELNEINTGNKVKFIFPNIVAIELINHLLESDLASKDCFKALYFLTHSAKENNAQSFKGQILPTIHDLITNYLFQQKSEHFKFNNNICIISHRLTESGNKDKIIEFENEIKQVIEFKKQELEDIIKNIENSYLKSLNQQGEIDWNIFDKNLALKTEFQRLIKNKSFHQIFGFALVQMAVDETGQENVEFKMSELQNGLFKDFEISIDFFVKHIWEKLIVIKKKEYLFDPESDPKKRWNSFYDLQLIFATEYENSFGRKTVLVTEESRIRDTFKKYGKPDLTMDLKGYKQFIKN
jgi:hypothetical protein